MRQDPLDGIMPMVERTGEPGGFAGRKEDTYAPLRGTSELDRPRHKERQADHRAHRPRWRYRREARVEVGAGLLDGRSLRHAHRLRGTGRRSPERPPPGDMLFGQRANHHAKSLRRRRDVGDTPEARLSRSTSENPPSTHSGEKGQERGPKPNAPALVLLCVDFRGYYWRQP